jgi:hypothetical protein
MKSIILLGFKNILQKKIVKVMLGANSEFHVEVWPRARECVFSVIHFVVNNQETFSSSNRTFHYYTHEYQQIYKLLFNLLVMYGRCCMFRHFIAIFRERF